MNNSWIPIIKSRSAARLLRHLLNCGWLLFFVHTTLFGQADSLLQNKRYLDSVIRANMQGEMEKNVRHFREKQSYSFSMEVFSQIRQTAGKAQEFLNKGFDTVAFEKELKELGAHQAQSVAGVFPVQESLPSYRNFTTTELLLGELVTRLNIRSRALQRYLGEAESFRSAIDSLITDTSIYHIPALEDSLLFNDYVTALISISTDVTPVDEQLNATLRSLRHLDQRVSLMRQVLLSNLKICAQYREELGRRLFKAELRTLATGAATFKSFPQAANGSLVKSWLLLQFYLHNNGGLLLFAAFFSLALALLLLVLTRKLKTNQATAAITEGRELLRYPVESALFLAISIGQFFFSWPPLVFYATAWLLAALTGSRIYWKSLSPSFRNSWLLFVILFLVIAADNLLLFYTPAERYFLLGVALLTMVIAARIALKNRRGPDRSFIGTGMPLFLTLFSLFSLIVNLTGHYNLCKILLTAGYFGVMSGVLLFFTGKMINDWLNIVSSAIQNGKSHISLNFRKDGHDIPGLLIWLLAGSWVILLMRNFPFYRVISSGVKEALHAERSVGNFNFTFSSIFIFLFVLIASLVFSKLIALFSSTKQVQPGMARSAKKGGINNWLLLIRIAVITAGILLAFASAGIPMDKITIIIGSLGVGIGLGLQNIVGNLFSGIILAFERPFEIGDQIEVDNRRGRVKEMGFRSSRIITFEGSEVIIPNGDLLSHHVINYTLSNNYTRVELMVGVKYGSDLQRIKEVLEDMLRRHPHVRQHPPPQVLLHAFSESAVDLRLLFWTDIGIWVELKSEIILAVDKAFRESGVEIPFPQLDVHIISSGGKGANSPGE